MFVSAFLLMPLIYQGNWILQEHPQVKISIQPLTIQAYTIKEGLMKGHLKDIKMFKDHSIKFKLYNVSFEKENSFNDYIQLFKMYQYVNIINSKYISITMSYCQPNELYLDYDYNSISKGSFHLIR
jgi:hypothetical protein